MAEVSQRVDLGKHLKQAGVRATLRGAGGFSIIEVSQSQRTRAEAVMREWGMHWVWRGEPRNPKAPIDNLRFASGVIVAPPGSVIQRGGKGLKGAHGHWPETPGMGAVFIAFGRGVSPGQRLGIISNLDVAPTILQLLGLEVPESLKGQVLFLPETVPSKVQKSKNEA
ncbi:MAG: hypothetical protein JRC77_07195 [Deltaproteobacteria bacterium]|nr:hypothetical protein [Deltaproteobacteria bacterium]